MTVLGDSSQSLPTKGALLPAAPTHLQPGLPRPAQAMQLGRVLLLTSLVRAVQAIAPDERIVESNPGRGHPREGCPGSQQPGTQMLFPC